MILKIWSVLKIFVSGGASFLSLLPDLFSIYNHVVTVMGEANTSQFLKDLDESTGMVAMSLNPTIAVDEKRRLRREALEKSRNIWGRITG